MIGQNKLLDFNKTVLLSAEADDGEGSRLRALSWDVSCMCRVSSQGYVQRACEYGQPQHAQPSATS